MAREDGVHTVTAASGGLSAKANRNGVDSEIDMAWEDVPYDVRQHLAAVFRYLNEINDRAVSTSDQETTDRKILVLNTGSLGG